MPAPQPGAGQILLRMRAAGMNPMDRTLASGAWRPAPAIFPMVLGVDGAGAVEGLGEDAGSAAQPAGGVIGHMMDELARDGGQMDQRSRPAGSRG